MQKNNANGGIMNSDDLTSPVEESFFNMDESQQHRSIEDISLKELNILNENFKTLLNEEISDETVSLTNDINKSPNKFYNLTDPIPSLKNDFNTPTSVEKSIISNRDYYSPFGSARTELSLLSPFKSPNNYNTSSKMNLTLFAYTNSAPIHLNSEKFGFNSPSCNNITESSISTPLSISTIDNEGIDFINLNINYSETSSLISSSPSSSSYSLESTSTSLGHINFDNTAKYISTTGNSVLTDEQYSSLYDAFEFNKQESLAENKLLEDLFKDEDANNLALRRRK